MQALFDMKSMDIQRAMLRFWGIWPQTNNERFNPRNLQALCNKFGVFTIAYLAIISGPVYMYESWGDIFKTFESACLIALMTFVLLCIVSLVTQRESHERVLLTLEKWYERDQQCSDGNQSIQDKTQKFTNLTFIWHINGINTGAVVTFMQWPFLLYFRKLYVSSWFPYDAYASPMFEITLTLFATVVMPTVICTLTVIQVLFMATLVQIIGQYKILRYNLRNIRTLSEKAVASKALQRSKQQRENTSGNSGNVSEDIPANADEPLVEIAQSKRQRPNREESSVTYIDLEASSQHLDRDESQSCETISTDVRNTFDLKPVTARPKIIYIKPFPSVERTETAESVGLIASNINDVNKEMELRLKMCMEHHQEIIWLTHEVEELYSTYITAQFACNLFGNAMGCLLISMAPHIDMKMWYPIGCNMCASILLGVLCALANMLTEESSKVKDAIYDCDWFEASDSFKRSMRIIISMSNQPMVMQIGALITLTMETFYNVTNKSYSYYTSLLSLK